MSDDPKDRGTDGRTVRGAGACSRELPDVAVPSDPSIDRDISTDPAPSPARQPAAGALSPEDYRTGGPEGTRPAEPGTGAPIETHELGAEAGEPPHEHAGGRRGGPGASAPREDDDLPRADQPPG
jgi:hypothetical protein